MVGITASFGNYLNIKGTRGSANRRLHQIIFARNVCVAAHHISNMGVNFLLCLLIYIPLFLAQVEVNQLRANEFYLKVFCEHKVRGFSRPIEATSSLGLEKRDSEMVQVRDFLLEPTQDPIRNWLKSGHVAVDSGDYQQDNRHRPK